MRHTLNSFVVGLWLSVAQFAIGAESSSVHWHTDYGAARAEAKARDLPLLIHFYGVHCGPCIQMERDIFSTREFRDIVSRGFVVAKLEAKRHLDLTEQFEIAGVPADVILGPSGEMLFQREGYKPGQGPSYVASLRKHAGTGPTFDASVSGVQRDRTNAGTVDSTTGGSLTQRKFREGVSNSKTLPFGDTASRNSANTERTRNSQAALTMTNDPSDKSNRSKLVDDASLDQLDNSANRAASTVKRTSGSGLSRSETASTTANRVNNAELGLDGFCPVALKETSQWEAGSSEFTSRFRGKTYQFVDQVAKKEFERHPEDFIPHRDGQDLVAQVDHRNSVMGTTRFAAYYNGQLYLFQSKESRGTFKKNPARYVRDPKFGNAID